MWLCKFFFNLFLQEKFILLFWLILYLLSLVLFKIVISIFNMAFEKLNSLGLFLAFDL